MDETISMALQLNLDPRKPGQSLRGSLSLPHGNGKKFAVAVFTDDANLAQQALEMGAVAAGGTNLIESIKNGSTSLTSIERTIATPELMSELSAIARLLGPRGLMPNPKLNTIQPKEHVLTTLERQMSGISNYRTDKTGIVRLSLGKGSFGVDKLTDNVRELMNEIQAVKPDSFGKGKKGSGKGSGKGTKYYLKAHLSSTQAKQSVLVDLRTIDPTSVFFMSDAEKVA
jgi:large subunit ribosomal protein L1